MHFDLKDFLLSGQIDPLSFGTTRKQMLEILGFPNDWGPQTVQMDAEISRYGSLEFYFPKKGDGLWMVFSDHLNPFEGSINLTLSPWIISETLHLPEAETIFKNEHIQYSVVHQQKLDAIDIVFSSGAVCRFEPSTELDTHLTRAFWLKVDQKELHPSSSKQVSVTLPLHAYEKFRHVAIKQKKSISNICSEWLVAHIDELDE
jgi:hypothetical protein